LIFLDDDQIPEAGKIAIQLAGSEKLAARHFKLAAARLRKPSPV
jgi:hypothetical protein